jgi:hypothetical protein
MRQDLKSLMDLIGFMLADVTRAYFSLHYAINLVPRKPQEGAFDDQLSGMLT